MKDVKRLIFILIGIGLIALGIFLMFDFLLQALKFVLGLIVMVIGIQLLFAGGRQRIRYQVMK